VHAGWARDRRLTAGCGQHFSGSCQRASYLLAETLGGTIHFNLQLLAVGQAHTVAAAGRGTHQQSVRVCTSGGIWLWRRKGWEKLDARLTAAAKTHRL
jgi:hypothetical protein